MSQARNRHGQIEQFSRFTSLGRTCCSFSPRPRWCRTRSNSISSLLQTCAVCLSQQRKTLPCTASPAGLGNTWHVPLPQTHQEHWGIPHPPWIWGSRKHCCSPIPASPMGLTEHGSIPHPQQPQTGFPLPNQSHRAGWKGKHFSLLSQTHHASLHQWGKGFFSLSNQPCRAGWEGMGHKVTESAAIKRQNWLLPFVAPLTFRSCGITRGKDNHFHPQRGAFQGHVLAGQKSGSKRHRGLRKRIQQYWRSLFPLSHHTQPQAIMAPRQTASV